MQQTDSDSHLWEDFKKGEQAALSRIYHLHADSLFRYGKKFSADSELVKDTIQDLFFDLIRSRANLGTTDHIYFYLIKSFRRKLFKSLTQTKKSRQNEEYDEALPASIVYSVEEDWIQKEHLSRKEEMVQKGLAELSPKQREILYYRFTCDFEYEQICEIMSMKYDSARKMVFRALKSLRENLADTNFILFYTSISVFYTVPKK
ncbi:MAG: sigma-70 family RNA polymerase sigma factor [Prolixibacteraceae bacterium]|nr:sigma-70 family RNA polymerase sigma factor [Prolixibacteraceae bacterium]